MLSPLYMAEISPPEIRGSLMALEQFSIVLGVVVGFWTGFLTRTSAFRLEVDFPPLTGLFISPRVSILANTPCNSTGSRHFTRSGMSLFATITALFGFARTSCRGSSSPRQITFAHPRGS